MYNIQTQETTGALGILMMLLPLMIMMACTLSIFSKKRNERNRSRFGVELEAIRKFGQDNVHFSAHARAMSKVIHRIRRLARQGKNNTPEEGAEFELFRNIVHSRYRLSQKLWAEWESMTQMQADIPHMGYTHEVTVNQHKTVTDGSLNHGGHELPTAPTMDVDVSPTMQELSYALRKGSGVDRSCGTHVHRGLVDPDKGWRNSTPIEKWEMIRINGVFNLIYKYFETVINSMVSESRRGANSYSNSLPPYFDTIVNENALTQWRYQTTPSSEYEAESTPSRNLIEGGYSKISQVVPNKPMLKHCSFRTDANGVVRGRYFTASVTDARDLSMRDQNDYKLMDDSRNFQTAELYGLKITDNATGAILTPKMQDAGTIVRYWNKHFNEKVIVYCEQNMSSKEQAINYFASKGIFRMNALDLIAHSAYQSVESQRWDQSDLRFGRDRWNRSNDESEFVSQGNYPSDWERGHRASGNARYSHVNPYALKKYGTIEVRQMQGILNPTKILMWCEFVDLITNKAVSAVENGRLKLPRTKNFYSMMSWFGFAKDDEFVGMWRRRISVINKDDYNVVNDIKCTTCGKHHCDKDNACGELQSYHLDSSDIDIYEMSGDEFIQYVVDQETVLVCNECENEYLHEQDWGDGYVDSREPVSIQCYCNDCETETHFQMDAAILTLVASIAMGLISPLALLVGCGIGFIHAAGKKWVYTARAKKLWHLLESRGGQAAGVGINWQGKKKRTKYRAATSSIAVKSKLDELLTEDVAYVMEHTRYATHGSNTPENAHPHISGGKHVMLVHNGVVSNHAEVYRELGIDPLGPVDSQAVAAALEAGGIEKVVDTCEGTMSLIWTDKRDPAGTLKFWTNGGNPLAFGRLDDPKTGAVACASTMTILEDTFEIPTKKGKKSRTRLASAYDCTIGTEYTVHPDGVITKRVIPGSKDTHLQTWATNWRNYSTSPKKAAGDADNCELPLGVDKDTYYGLSRDEIMEKMYEVADYEMGVMCWPPFTIVNQYNRTVRIHGYNSIKGEGSVQAWSGSGVETYYLDWDVMKMLDDQSHDDWEDWAWGVCIGEHKPTFPVAYETYWHGY